MGQGPQGPPGLVGMMGVPGDQGDKGFTGNQGPPGDIIASINYNKITQELTSNKDYVSSLSNTILNSNKTFADSIARSLVKNDKLLDTLKDSLINKTLFLNKIATELTTNKDLINKLRGPKGEMASIDYNTLSNKIMAFLPTLSETINTNPNVNKQLTNAIIKYLQTTSGDTTGSYSLIKSIEPALKNNATFALNVANSIINSTTLLPQIKGDTGAQMDITKKDMVKQILFTNRINKCDSQPLPNCKLNAYGVCSEYTCIPQIDPYSKSPTVSKSNGTANNVNDIFQENIDFQCNQQAKDCTTNGAIIWCDNNECIVPPGAKGININNNATIIDDDSDLHITTNTNNLNLKNDTTFSTSTVNVNGNLQMKNINFLPLQNKWALWDNGNMTFQYSDDGKSYYTKAYIDDANLHVNSINLGSWSIGKDGDTLAFKYNGNYKAHVAQNGNIYSWKNIGTNTGVKFNGNGGWWIRPHNDKNWLNIGKDGYGSTGVHTVFGSGWNNDRFQIWNSNGSNFFIVNSMAQPYNK